MLPPQFLSHPPSFSPSTELERVMAALVTEPLSTPEHLIVVDAEQRPLGVIPLGKLWIWHQHPPPCPSQAAAVPPQLKDWQAYWEPVFPISAAIPMENLGTHLQAQPQGHWVTVDRVGRYQAYIEARGMLAWLLPQLSVLPPPPTQDRHGWHNPPPQSLTPRQQDWLMGLSHALKTPLTSLLGLSSLLLDPRVGPLSDRQTRYATLMRRAIRHLIRMINEWVDGLRLESGDLVLDWQEVDLTSLLADLLPQFLNSRLPDQPSPPDWINQFTLDCQTPVASLGGDQRRLEQSLHSSLDYLLHQGSEPLGLSLNRWATWLCLHLRGTYPKGQPCPDLIPPGVPALDQLGLPLARQLCQAHGGELGGFCSPRQGYHLTLLIPLQQETPAGTTVVVMLVSRAISIIDEVYGQLQDSPYGLVVVTNPAEASRVADRLSPGVVIWHGESFSPPLLPPASLGDRLLEITKATETHGDSSAGLGATAIAPEDLGPALISTLRARLDNHAQPLTLVLLQGPAHGPGLSPQWHQSLQNQQCCLLQAEDVDQAKLLCQIWQPDAIVLDQQDPISTEYLIQLSQIPDLAARPLVLLSASPDAKPDPLKLVEADRIITHSPNQGGAQLIESINQYLGKGHK